MANYIISNVFRTIATIIISGFVILHSILCVNYMVEAQRNDSITDPVAMFVFGDSLVDSGNNKYISSTARADFMPNGIDYPTHKPTGRFCNGKLIADFISDYLGQPPVQAFLDPSVNESSLLVGANFASAGAGIINTTGRLFINVINVEEQFQLFQEYKMRMAGFMGEQEMEKLIAKGLFSLTFGGNDYINNYLMPNAQSKKQYNLQQWQDLLMSTYKSQIIQLYNMGARKVSITSLGPIGCIPSQLNIQKSLNGACIDFLQQIAINFNGALQSILEDLNAQFPDATFVYINSFDMVMDYISHPNAYGFKVSNTACCGQGKYNGFLICTRFSSLCQDRDSYVFWDPYHPSEHVNMLITQRVINGPPSDIRPVNLKQLLAI